MSKTLMNYIELLRPVQQDYIVFCVQTYSDKPDFHRGLLPFLDPEEAARCLQFHLETIKSSQAVPDLEASSKAVLGEKFIRQIISVFRSSLIYRLSEDEASEVIYLNTVKLKRHYGKRFGNKFCVTLLESGVSLKRPITGLFELQMISRNQWKVTGHKDYLWAVTDHLNDYFG